MSYPREVKEYYRDAYERAKSQGDTSLSFKAFVLAEKAKIVSLVESFTTKQDGVSIDWVSVVKQLRTDGKISKYIPLTTLQKIVQVSGGKDINIERAFDFPANTLTQDTKLQNTAVPRSDDLITSQSDSTYTYAIEWISNAIDAVTPQNQIGRFGEGFFQSLQHLQEDDGEIVVSSRTETAHAYQVSLKKRKKEILVAPQGTTQQGRGTSVSLKKKLTDNDQKVLREHIVKKFCVNTRARITVNGVQINNFGEYQYINGQERPNIDSLPLIDVRIDSAGVTVHDTGIGMNAHNLAGKLLYPNTTSKKRQKISDKHVKEYAPAETRFFYKSKSHPKDKTHIRLQVAGVMIEEFRVASSGNIGELIFEFPSFSPLEDSRNEIKVGRETTIALTTALKKIGTTSKDIREKLGLLESIGAIYHHLKDRPTNIVDEEFTLETNMKKAFGDIRVDIEKNGITVLPAHEGLINTIGMRVDVFYIDADFIDFDISTIPGIKELSESIVGKRGSHKGKQVRFFEVDFDSDSRHDYLLYGEYILVNRSILKSRDAQETDQVIQALNAGINLNTGYELRSEMVHYGRLPTSHEGKLLASEVRKKQGKISLGDIQATAIQGHTGVPQGAGEIESIEEKYELYYEYFLQEFEAFREQYAHKFTGKSPLNLNSKEVIIAALKRGKEIEDIITVYKVSYILNYPLIIGQYCNGVQISEIDSFGFLLDFLESKNSSLTIPSFRFLGHVISHMSEDIEGFIRYTHTLFRALEQDPKNVLILMDEFSPDKIKGGETSCYGLFQIFRDIVEEKKRSVRIGKKGRESKKTVSGYQLDIQKLSSITHDLFPRGSIKYTKVIQILERLDTLSSEKLSKLRIYLLFTDYYELDLEIIQSMLGGELGNAENDGEIFVGLQSVFLQENKNQKEPRWDDYTLGSWFNPDYFNNHIQDGESINDTIVGTCMSLEKAVGEGSISKSEFLRLRELIFIYHGIDPNDNETKDKIERDIRYIISDDFTISGLYVYFSKEDTNNLITQGHLTLLSEYGYELKGGKLSKKSPEVDEDVGEIIDSNIVWKVFGDPQSLSHTLFENTTRLVNFIQNLQDISSLQYYNLRELLLERDYFSIREVLNIIPDLDDILPWDGMTRIMILEMMKKVLQYQLDEHKKLSKHSQKDDTVNLSQGEYQFPENISEIIDIILSLPGTMTHVLGFLIQKLRETKTPSDLYAIRKQVLDGTMDYESFGELIEEIAASSGDDRLHQYDHTFLKTLDYLKQIFEYEIDKKEWDEYMTYSYLNDDNNEKTIYRLHKKILELLHTRRGEAGQEEFEKGYKQIWRKTCLLAYILKYGDREILHNYGIEQSEDNNIVETLLNDINNYFKGITRPESYIYATYQQYLITEYGDNKDRWHEMVRKLDYYDILSELGLSPTRKKDTEIKVRKKDIPKDSISQVTLSEDFFASLSGKYPAEILAFAQFLESNGEYLSPRESQVQISEHGVLSTSLSHIIGTSLQYNTTISSGVNLSNFASLLGQSDKHTQQFQDIIAGVCLAQDEVSMYFLREGIQNARDALIGSGKSEEGIKVEFYEKDGKFTSSITDSVGMQLSDIIIKLFTPYNSGKTGTEATGKFGKGFFTFAVGCSELRIKSSTGNGTVSYIKMIPQFTDGIIRDFEVYIEIREEDFTGTIIERADELGGIYGNLRALIGTHLLKKYTAHTEDVPIEFGEHRLNPASNKSLLGERRVYVTEQGDEMQTGEEVRFEDLRKKFGNNKGTLMGILLEKELGDLSGHNLIYDNKGKILGLRNRLNGERKGEGLGFLRVYRSTDGIERFTKDNLWISEIKQELISDFPEWIQKFIRDRKLSIDIPRDTPLVGSRNSLENKDYYLSILKPYLYRIVIDIILKEHITQGLKIPMMPEDYLALLAYEHRGVAQVTNLALSYNADSGYRLTESELKLLSDPAHMAQFLTLVDFEHDGQKASLRAIKKQIHDNRKTSGFAGRFSEKINQAVNTKGSLNSTVEKYNLGYDEIESLTGLEQQDIEGFERFISTRFKKVIEKRFGEYHVSFHRNSKGGEIANSYGNGGYGCSFRVDTPEFTRLVKNISLPETQERIISIVAHEMTHSEEDRLGLRKWGTHETDELHNQSFMRINREILTELGRTVSIG